MEGRNGNGDLARLSRPEPGRPHARLGRADGGGCIRLPRRSRAWDERAKWSHNDQERATENGACGIALLALRELTGLTVLLQSRRGSGFDFWLGPETGFLFQAGVRLEVSGIRRGDEPVIRRRLRSKLRQTERSRHLAPAYVAVVEFSRPALRVIKR